MRAAPVVSLVLAACAAAWADTRGKPPFPFPSPAARSEFFTRLVVEKWMGRPVEELISTWGAPTSVEDERGGGQALVYRMRFFEGFQITPDHHVALSIDGPFPVSGIYISIPGKPVPKLVGRLKARFRADEDGTIVDVRILSLKWTNSRRFRADHAAEEPAEPRKPFKADVEVGPD